MPADPAMLVFRLRRHKAALLDQVSALLDHAVRSGLSAAEASKRVSQYFAPWFATRRGPGGELRRAGRTGLVPGAPGEAGMASAPARRLMLNESREAHALSVRSTAAKALETVQWLLSPDHDERDECDGFAHADSGYGPGHYVPWAVPAFPHVGCRCMLRRGVPMLPGVHPSR